MKGLSRFVSYDGRSSRAFARNVLFKVFADGVSKIVTLLVMVASARVLPTADFGVLALAMTTGWILSVASDAGLPIYLAKRLAHPATGGATSFAAVAEVMRARIALASAAALVGVAVAMGSAPQTLFPFTIIVLAQLLNAVVDTLSHAYRGLGRTNIEAGVVLSQRTATAAVVLFVLATAPSVALLSLALAAPPAIALLVSWRIARRLTRIDVDGAEGEGHAAQPSRPFWPLLSLRLLRSDVAPLGAATLVSAIYFRCDVYFVQAWHGAETVGVYNAAFRIVEALRLFPAAVLAVSFASLCASQDLRTLQRLSVMLLLGGLALFGVVYMTAPTVLGVVYGTRFVEAAPALRILSAALPLFFVNYALTHQVIAWDGQRAYLAITATALVTNLAANSILIPGDGMVGAAISTVVTEVVVGVGCVIALIKPRNAVRPPAFASSPATSLTGDAR